MISESIRANMKVPQWLEKLGANVEMLSARNRVPKSRAEFEQSLLRVVIALIVMFYLFCYTFRQRVVTPNELQVFAVSVVFFLFAVALSIHVLLNSAPSIARRYVGMIADNAVTTYCLMNMGEGGAVVIGVYLFITFGNGFRYGRSYLHACQAMGLVGFSSVLIYSDFWSRHLPIGLGFLIGLLVLPLYVGVLAERIEKAKRRADDANQAKGRFVANVSHEMRTPLNGVIAMADVLRETELSESQREIVETMTTSAHLLLAQIEDVLDMAKIEAGRVHIELRPTDLGRLLSSTVKIVLSQARYKGITLTTEIADDAAAWFLTDMHHLRQIILNLLSNAVKFTERGHVTLRARVLQRNGDQVSLRIEVEDTGIGIPPHKQVEIFEPFAQADDSITRVYGGTGLGTTIARQLVELMGGAIGLSSEVNVGSLFWIELPLTIAPPQAPDAVEVNESGARISRRAATMRASKAARILVAEDNQTNQRVARVILESAGYTVTIADNGDKALDLLEQGNFDLALFDLSMPMVSGLDALKLYRFTTSRPIPILILSANVTSDLITQCRNAGAAEFISKPLRASILLDAVGRHLNEIEIERNSSDAESERHSVVPQLCVVDTPSIDQSVIDDLAKLSTDVTFVDRLVTGFKSDMNRLTKEIRDCLQRRHFEAAKDAAHALKGGAASVGAMQLAQFAKRLETTSHDMLRAKTTQLILELDQIAARASTELDRKTAKYRLGEATPISGT